MCVLFQNTDIGAQIWPVRIKRCKITLFHPNVKIL